MQLFQDDNLGLLSILTGTILCLGLVVNLFFSPVKQKVYIDKNLSISEDTIVQENSRWYYTSDSSNKDIKISIYKDKTGTPYEEVYLQPDDFVDLELKNGVNILHLKTLGSYPFVYKRYKVLQYKEEKIPNSYKLKHLLDNK
jgi:hypothetical protein